MGRRRRKNAKKQALCSVCQNSCVSSSSFLTRCSTCTTMSRHTLCDGCFYKHIFTTISNDITSRVICPEPMCDTELSKEIIQSAFHAFGNQPLWEDYVSRSNWHGKSNQWIKNFSVRCPDCRVPIEKNGGCDRMTCTQCLLCFSWERAKFSKNPFVGNPFGGGFASQFPGPFSQQGFGQFGGNGRFFNGSMPFSGGNMFSHGSTFSPPANFTFSPGFPQASRFPTMQGFPQLSGFPQAQGFPPPQGFPPSSGFPSPPVPGFSPDLNGFGFQNPPQAVTFLPGQQPPPPPLANTNYFANGPYAQPQSRQSSRHRSSSRRHSSSRHRSTSSHRRRHRRRRRSRSTSSSISSLSSDSSYDPPLPSNPMPPFASLYANPHQYPTIPPPPIEPRTGTPIMPPAPIW
ncbi:unnamed protein product [Adineta steineri]|uniref:RING-type domain-containing protein n=1 Tax=Adineta steineri TaxID=433720 RepID=A0A814EK27_9BILA|nr:unnamed protein product [Adineta steineri]CAF0970520.1 unnamed protein product [Adineta steineri]